MLLLEATAKAFEEKERQRPLSLSLPVSIEQQRKPLLLLLCPKNPEKSVLILKIDIFLKAPYDNNAKINVFLNFFFKLNE